jgi:hypothetical protein
MCKTSFIELTHALQPQLLILEVGQSKLLGSMPGGRASANSNLPFR